MKKAIAIVIGLVLALSLFAGGKQEAGTGKPQKVTFWYSYGGNNRKVTEELITQFNESQSKYAVEGSFQGGYFEALGKFRAAVASGTAPALIHVVGEVLPQLFKAGVVEDLGPYAKTKDPTNLKDYTYALNQDGYFDYLGEKTFLFAIPFNRSTPIMYTNKGMLASKGVKPPKTWDELNAAAEKLTVKASDGSVDVYGYEVPLSWWFWVAKVYQAGGTVLNSDGSKAAFRDQGIAAIEDWKKMVDAKIMKRPPGKDYNAWEVTNNDFINQKAGIIWTSTAFLTYLTENAKFDIECAFLPKKEKYAVPTGGTFFIMTKNVKQAEKDGGWAFLKWITDTDQTIFWSQKTGYMAVRDSALKTTKMKDFLKANKNFAISYDQLQNAFQFPFSQALFDIQRQVIQPNLEAPVLGMKSVEAAMDDAIKEANKYLAKY